jgi:hypothetical protein
MCLDGPANKAEQALQARKLRPNAPSAGKTPTGGLHVGLERASV